MASKNAPWADTPFTLIPTPGRGENLAKLDDILYIAREMANAHNCMLRALNSIYQQCVFVKEPEDVKDLLLYASFWCDWIHEHHEGEENFFFPLIETISGVRGLMEVNVEQHHTFIGGLDELQKFAKETRVEKFDGREMRKIIEAFGGNLTKHLTEEIETLLGLKIYDGSALRKAYVVFELQLRKGDKNILYPIVLGSADRSYEEGFDWPEVPGPIRVVIHYWFERKYRGVWRFSPSTTWGERRPLMFTQKAV